MYDQLLFPTDGSDGAAVAFDHVLDIATTHDATVHILNVADTTQESVTHIQGEVVDVLEQEGEQLVRETAERAHQRGVDTVTDVLQGEPYSTIIDYANSRGVDLIVMPTHGRQGLNRYLLGSTTERVIRRADTPVLTIPMDDDRSIDYPYRNVLVPTDGSACATRALELGAEVANKTGVVLHLLSVITVPSFGLDVRSDVEKTMEAETAHELLDDATDLAEAAGVESVSTTVEYESSIHEAILAYIEEHSIDLVVVGTHGRTGFDRYVLGSVTDYLVRTSPIPVLTVRGPAPDAESA